MSRQRSKRDWTSLGLGYAAGVPKSMMGERFNMYAALCKEGRYSWCMAADFRDVFFQANPFAAQVLKASRHNQNLDGVDLVLPLEDRKLGTCPINSYVVRRCFGAAFSAVTVVSPANFAALRLSVPH